MTGFEAVLVTLGGHVQPDASGGVGDPFTHEPEKTEATTTCEELPDPA